MLESEATAEETSQIVKRIAVTFAKIASDLHVVATDAMKRHYYRCTTGESLYKVIIRLGRELRHGLAVNAFNLFIFGSEVMLTVGPKHTSAQDECVHGYRKCSQLYWHPAATMSRSGARLHIASAIFSHLLAALLNRTHKRKLFTDFLQ